MPDRLFLGLDFGTESIRALIVDRTSHECGSAVAQFEHGQIVPGSAGAKRLFDHPLPPHFALQHPQDWIDSAAEAVQHASRGIDSERIASIGVDFTSCTMLPCAADGTPLMLTRDDLARTPHAWPKLWKHHGALTQTETINRVARERNEAFLARYGGIIGLEWFFPKILEVIENAPEMNDTTDVWVEGGDWFVWQLVGGEASDLPRSTCQAGYKACWSKEDGYPSREFLNACHPTFGEVVERKLPGRMIAPGECAGTLCDSLARRLRLSTGIPVSAAIIDAHAGVPGAGVGKAGALVMVLGTSGCHMLLADEEVMIPGVAGIVRDGILPGFVGYETGQAAMGDAFDWARRVLGHSDFEKLDRAAREVAPGSDDLVCLDWFNGCRTPLMDGGLQGAISGLTLHHTAAHMYRAVLESSALGLRWVVETLRAGVQVNRFIATGGLPHHNPLFIEIVASALGAPVEIHGCRHGPALGAAILGACAAGAFGSVHEAIESMAGASSAQPESRIVQPHPAASDAYESLFEKYLALGRVVRSSE